MSSFGDAPTNDSIYLRVVGQKKEITKEKALSLWQEGRITGLFNIPNQQVFEACKDFCVQELDEPIDPSESSLKAQLHLFVNKNVELSHLMNKLKTQVTELTNENKAHQAQIQYWALAHKQIVEDNERLREKLRDFGRLGDLAMHLQNEISAMKIEVSKRKLPNNPETQEGTQTPEKQNQISLLENTPPTITNVNFNTVNAINAVTNINITIEPSPPATPPTPTTSVSPISSPSQTSGSEVVPNPSIIDIQKSAMSSEEISNYLIKGIGETVTQSQESLPPSPSPSNVLLQNYNQQVFAILENIQYLKIEIKRAWQGSKYERKETEVLNQQNPISSACNHMWLQTEKLGSDFLKLSSSVQMICSEIGKEKEDKKEQPEVKEIQRKQKNTEIQSLKNELANLKKENDQNVQKTKQGVTEILRLKNENLKFKQEKEALEQQLKKQKGVAESKKLKNENLQLKKDKEKHNSQLRKYQQEITEVQKRYQLEMAEIENLKGEFAKTKQDCEHDVELLSQIQNLKGDNTKMQQKILDYDVQSKQYEEDFLQIQKLKEENQRLKEDNDRHDFQLKKFQQEMAIVQNRYQTEVSEIQSLKSEFLMAIQQEKDRNGLLLELQALKSENEKHDLQIKKYEEELGEMRSFTKKAFGTYDSHQLITAVQFLTDENTRLREEKQDCDIVAQQFQIEIGEIQKLKSLCDVLQDMERNDSMTVIENQMLKKKIEKKDKKIQRLESSDSKTLEVELERMKISCEKLQGENNVLKSELSQHIEILTSELPKSFALPQIDIEQIKDNVSLLESQIQRSQKENDMLREEKTRLEARQNLESQEVQKLREGVYQLKQQSHQQNVQVLLEVQKLKDENSKLHHARNQEVSILKKESEKKCQKLQRELNESKKEVERLAKLRQNENTENQKLKSEKEKLLNEKEKQHQRDITELQKIRKDVKGIKNELNSVKEEKQKMNVKIEEQNYLKSHIQQLDLSLKNAMSEQESLRSQVLVIQEKNQKLQLEVSQRQGIEQQLENAILELSKVKNSFQSDKQEFQKKWKDAKQRLNEELKEAEGEIAQLYQENRALQSQIKDLGQKLEQNSTRDGSLTAELNKQVLQSYWNFLSTNPWATVNEIPVAEETDEWNEKGYVDAIYGQFKPNQSSGSGS